ncbi:MAG: phosphatidylserine/phosphatidylglycerophosphate/cardiolipin synthase family protein [Candidatus Vogelbacteria bacterium]|nr:phosphatidylserine/phosphatidylglycerophosphate/cardiolipin synthase family protein [Candidatus Vogelbacteria bacterium]
MKHRLYSTSESAMNAMLDSIGKATRSILFESYIFIDDAIPAKSFMADLISKARLGVKVVLILDGLGSYSLPAKDVESLREAGGEILFFTRWFRRIHRKLLIVDEKIAFFGGVNIGKHYLKWLDLHMRVSGKLVASFVKTFAKSYSLCGGTDSYIIDKEKLPDPISKTRIWILEHWPVLGSFNLKKHYEESILGAEKEIVIVTPYFIPHPWLLKALKNAAKRGVNISIILPENTDPKIGNTANHLNALRYANSRMKFFFTRQMMHAKALLIDNKQGMIGSPNIDAQSFDHNTEIGAVFSDTRMINDLQKIIDMWKADSRSLEELNWRLRWYHSPLLFLLDLLQPFL